MNREAPTFQVSLAQTDADLKAAQRLRYDVFVTELGATVPDADHLSRLERDRFDQHAVHVLLRDAMRPIDDQVVGTYRLLTAEGAEAAGQFYCEDEYDLAPLKTSGLRLLELGRSCVHPAYRGGHGLMHIWSALADFVAAESIDLLFGVASFHGTDPHALAEPLSLLHGLHMAPEEMRVTARTPGAHPMNMIPADDLDRVKAMRQIPALIKAYLRLGGMVGEGAYIDHDFNTVDICLILPTKAIDEMRRKIYGRGVGLG